MIRLFSSFNTISLPVLFLYTILLRLAIFFCFDEVLLTFDSASIQAPLTTLVFSWFAHIPVKLAWMHFIGSTIIIYGQSLMINALFFKHKIFKNATYLPSLAYTICVSALPEFLLISGPMLATTFVIWSIQLQFGSFKDDKAYSKAFLTGLLHALAYLFYAPYLVFFLFAYVSWTSIRPFVWREYFILFLGFLFPLYGVFSIAYFTDHLAELTSMMQSNITFHPHWIGSVKWLRPILLLAFGVITGFGLQRIQRIISKSVIQIRIYLRLFNYLLIPLFISILLLGSFNYTHFFIIGIPMTALVIECLKAFKRQYIAEIIHLILLILILSIQYQTKLMTA